MLEIQSIDELKRTIKRFKNENKTIGFVPTMGNLHSGHLSLIDKANELCDIVISSIFVNPLQFGENEDLSTYPRTLENDINFLKHHDCHAVFLPNSDTLISNNITKVSVAGISNDLEGKIRDGHMDGVATIVTKLFNIVQPDVACFGKKDYQQWIMIKKMVADLNMDIKIVGCKTLREPDGLAMSSRNQYLDPTQREKAPLFHQVLQKCAQSLQSNHSLLALDNAKNELLEHGFTIDYLELRKQSTLEMTQDINNAVLISTVRLGTTRLLDNIEL